MPFVLVGCFDSDENSATSEVSDTATGVINALAVNAGEDLTVDERSSVVLQASLSNIGDDVSVSWSQV